MDEINDNYRIDKALVEFKAKPNRENAVGVMETIRLSMDMEKNILVPVELPDGITDWESLLDPSGNFVVAEDTPINIRTLGNPEGTDSYYVAFTNADELSKGQPTASLEIDINELIDMFNDNDEIDGIVLNPWGISFLLDKDMIEMIVEADDAPMIKSHIFINEGDIRDVDVDCIVVANESEAVDVGEAAASEEDDKFDYIIYTTGPRYTGTDQCKEQLTLCYQASLDLARSLNIHNIAFPSISTGGELGYPMPESVMDATYAVTDWLNDNQDYGIEVIFYCSDHETFEAYKSFFDFMQKEATPEE
ncbi:SseB family protein [Aminicella lysinilytica]|uniref:O-acetyl-ADP-ribose deacetylase (Regulator of RNase III) n=1 Tax=Aminicella lysinilytica TaxID=433323 RepID=A0A4R6Q4P9_9FIRM|nr:SseB family protein [Aminicella lysinilytica]TDP56463.1 O-acetyl-ADP-ribose deacetylase (regulator of RNase III) [Aminicella lysinilytica]